ncbi:MAG: nucleotide pyrophosphohydrolase [Lachnospiraceae bacterium]|nr:nucleotide pyrophosphohydrolase [Lachnospiraceae bacterium]
MKEMQRLKEVVKQLRAPDGCPWDRQQTHGSLKAACVEEAAEVIGGIRILEETGSAENLREELGDLLLQVVMHAQIAEEEGLFDLEDVAKTVADKMVRRHPHVFAEQNGMSAGEVPLGWEEIKKREKDGREWESAYLPGAMEEATELLEVAKKRKGFI